MLNNFVLFFLISSFILSQNIDSCTNRCDFSVGEWLLWSLSKTYCLREVGITILLPFSTIPSITFRSSWNVLFSCISCHTPALGNGQPYIIHVVSTCKCLPCFVVLYNSCVNMHILGYLCRLPWCWCLFMQEISLSYNGFVKAANLIWSSGLGQDCVISIFCIGVCIAGCIVHSVTELLHTFWR